MHVVDPVESGREALQEATDAARSTAGTEEGKAVSPGQLLKHYAPSGVDTFIVTAEAELGVVSTVSGGVIVIDIGGRLKHLLGGRTADNGRGVRASKGAAHTPFFYRDLSPADNGAEAAQELFAALRWAEAVAAEGQESTQEQEEQGGWVVLVPDLRTGAATDEPLAAVWDRLYRSASGNFL